MTRRTPGPATRRGRASAAPRAGKAAGKSAGRPAAAVTLPPSPATLRAHTFNQWMLAGALAGIILSVAQQQSPWEGAMLFSNIVQAIGAGMATGLVARGACWIWLARQT